MNTTSLAIASATAVALFSLGWCRHDSELAAVSRGPDLRLDPIQGAERALTARAPKVPPPNSLDETRSGSVRFRW